MVKILPRAQRHHYFFQRAIAGPFADAVDRAFNLPGAVLDAGQAVGHGQAQIVVAMHANHGPIDVRHTVLQRANNVRVMRWRGIADRVGNVHRRCAGVDGGLHHLAQEIDLRSGSIFRRKLDIIAIADGPLHASHRPGE